MKRFELSIQKAVWQNGPIYEHLGLTVESSSNGVYRCRLPLNERTRNHFGTIVAPLQSAAAEVLGGLVVLSHFDLSSLFFVIRSLSVQFLKPARTDVLAEARFSDAQVNEMKQALESRGEAGFNLHAVLRDKSGRIVAEADAAYLIRTRRE